MRIIDVLNSPWAIRPDRLLEINEIYVRHLRGEKITKDTISLIEAQTGKPLKNEPKGYEVVKGVAVLPVDGVLSKKMNLFARISGGTSTELLTRDFNEALGDPSVKAIILNVDSPGGTVDGTQEFANTVYAAKDMKPVCAFTNGMMASAAYWIGSAAQGGIFISGDTVDVGSIGVVTSHTDYSKAYEERGIKVTELTAGKYKRIASEYAPLSDEGKAYIQDQLDHIYNVFLSDVGKNRGGMGPDQVHNQMADGRIFIGKKAIDAGLVDGVSTLDDMINQMASGKMPKKQKGMQVVVPEVPKGAEVQSAAGDVAAEIETNKEAIMNLAELKEKHPDLYKAVQDEGRALGIEDGKAQGRTEELARIKAVKAVAMPGHEAFIETLMFDGKTTGPEAAVKVIEAENVKRTAKADAIKKDGEDIKIPTPDASDAEDMKKVKTRKEYEAMSPADRAAFVKAGGKFKD